MLTESQLSLPEFRGSALSGLAPDLRELWRWAVLEAWIDDSGTRGRGRVFIYAGFVAPAERWLDFAEEWRKVLATDPPIRHFHMHDAAHLTGEFNRWGRGVVYTKIDYLLNVIRAHAEYALMAVMHLADYENCIGHTPVPKEVDYPQFLAFHGLIAGVIRRLNQYVDFHFDDDPIHQRKLQKFWNLARANAPDDIARFMQPQPLFRDDQEFTPLQAADLLAWNMRRMSDGLSDYGWILDGLQSTPLLLLELDAAMLPNLLRETEAVRDPEFIREIDP